MSGISELCICIEEIGKSFKHMKVAGGGKKLFLNFAVWTMECVLCLVKDKSILSSYISTVNPDLYLKAL